MELSIIERTSVGMEEDHRFPIVVLHLGGPGWGQSTQVPVVGRKEPEDSPRRAWGVEWRGKAIGFDFMLRILEVVGCREWEHLYRKRVYAIREVPYGRIIGIANLDRPETKYLLFEPYIEEFSILNNEWDSLPKEDGGERPSVS
jgi:hypothetical protein